MIFHILNNFWNLRKYLVKFKLTLRSSNWHYECRWGGCIGRKGQYWPRVIISNILWCYLW